MEIFTRRQRKEKDGAISFDGNDTIQTGLIAQEVYPILPDVVYKPVDETQEFWNVDYVRIIPALINSIKELKGRIEELEEQLKDKK